MIRNIYIRLLTFCGESFDSIYYNLHKLLFTRFILSININFMFMLEYPLAVIVSRVYFILAEFAWPIAITHFDFHLLNFGTKCI